ncbi:hypothetical protein O3P69_016724 [Scylla paramamosain]|uniref:Uncharacterized protein n=1 Tax=Scylla paramamosain TaxID=85552 RepID=A0AAW0SZC9_SCYPA
MLILFYLHSRTSWRPGGLVTGAGHFAVVDRGVGHFTGVDRGVGHFAGVDKGVGHFTGVDRRAACLRLGASGGAKGWVSGGRGGAGKGRKEQEFGRQMTVRRLV